MKYKWKKYIEDINNIVFVVSNDPRNDNFLEALLYAKNLKKDIIVFFLESYEDIIDDIFCNYEKIERHKASDIDSLKKEYLVWTQDKFGIYVDSWRRY